METHNDLISVVMSNYNTPENYLREAIESVINQTYKNFELIIIDDCSTDNSLEIINSYKDERIIIVKNEQNLGITKSLNKGLKIATGDFVARMDADDICFPTRFEKQVEFLKSNPKVIVCGTGIELIGEWEERHSNKLICNEIPEKDLFSIYLLFGNSLNIAHPTAMFNNKLLAKYNIKYDEDFPVAQDYKMWVTCCNYGECANLKETLLYYRVHGGAVSSSRTEKQLSCVFMNMKQQLATIGIDLKHEDEEIHHNFLSKRHPYDLRYKKWIEKIILQNQKYRVYNQKKLETVLWKKWVETSYFQLTKERNIINMVRVITNVPLKYLYVFLEIKNKRKKNFSLSK